MTFVNRPLTAIRARACRLPRAHQGPTRPLRWLLTGLAAMLLMPAAHAQNLTIYSAGPNNLIRDLAAGYEAKTGNRVDVFQSSTGRVMARLEAERANPVADVVISASWDSAKALKEAGDLLAYTPTGADQVPASLKDSHFIAQGVSALALVWNQGSKVPRPSDWTDLAKPEYANQVTMPDPAQSGAAFELVTGLLTSMGEEPTWSLLEQLKQNGMIVPGPNAQALNPVLQGGKSVVFGAVDYISFGQKEQGENIDVIFPSGGTVIAPRPMMILNTTKHPDQAKAFLDYVLSVEGQSKVASVYLMPARTDVEGLRPGVNDLNIINVNSEEMGARRDAILRQFRQTMGL